MTRIKRTVRRRKEIVSARTRQHFVSIITERVSILLQMMYQHPDELVDLESGEKYICSVCDMDHKRCEEDPDYRCEIARKHETEFKELELALDRIRKGTFGFCATCSKFIGVEILEKYPTRVFCDECAKGFV
jgi:RNA polymerase-binding transcription factor DksA